MSSAPSNPLLPLLPQLNAAAQDISAQLQQAQSDLAAAKQQLASAQVAAAQQAQIAVAKANQPLPADRTKYGNLWRGPDGHCLVVVCPDGHQWMVDDRASNCTMKDDNIHKCWVRHGTPPNITVDKAGVTCQAGAGSILTPKWHGFLTNGVLSESR